MRPSLNILSDELIGRIVDEAKRVLAEVGMEVRFSEEEGEEGPQASTVALVGKRPSKG